LCVLSGSAVLPQLHNYGEKELLFYTFGAELEKVNVGVAST